MLDESLKSASWLRQHLCHAQDLKPENDHHNHDSLLKSHHHPINQALQGGFRSGSLVEWGLPPGKRGYEVLLSFLTEAPPLSLWVYEGSLKVYPPAWIARGVRLNRIHFAKSHEPLQDLRPALTEPLFGLLVLDQTTGLRREDFAFLHKQARRIRQTLFITRPYILSHQNGNPMVRYRLNAWYDHWKQQFHLNILKGGDVLLPSLSISPEQLCRKDDQCRP